MRCWWLLTTAAEADEGEEEVEAGNLKSLALEEEEDPPPPPPFPCCWSLRPRSSWNLVKYIYNKCFRFFHGKSTGRNIIHLIHSAPE